MSGINTLIDTLMHQVLGKRVDTPPPRELAEPVRPLAPSEAPRALHSDSRLDARPRHLPEAAPTPREVAGPRSPGRPERLATAPPSTQTHLTPTARTIADLLLRFPAPPSALRPAQPLLPEAVQGPPERLAERLQRSVRDSGLFYETHLTRWYRGELPRLQLQREPQMRQMRPLVPVTPEASLAQLQPLRVKVPGTLEGLRGTIHGGAGGTGRDAAPAGTISPSPPPGVAAPGSGMPPGVVAEAPGGRTPGTASGEERMMRPAAGEGMTARWHEPVPEGLQSLVRHQLELLVTPVLRWEGDVWTGLFMALTIQLPQAGREGEEAADREGGKAQRDGQGWRSEMRLQVAGLGEIAVSLWWRERRLDLALASSDPAVRARLEAGRERLAERLSACGPGEVDIRILADGGEVRDGE